MKMSLITLDTVDPQKLAPFWAALTGCEVEQDYGEYLVFSRPQEGGPRLALQQVAEAKAGKNRMHPDFHVEDLEAEEARILELGAVVVDRKEIPGLRWVVFNDPEGNEFCVGQLG